MRAYGVTDRGRIRETNEDCYAIDHDLRLVVVADGMGGHRAGEVASRMAVDTVIDYVGRSAVTTTWPFGFDVSFSEASNLLRTAIHVANSRIFEAALVRPDYFGMGTTTVAVLVRDGLCRLRTSATAACPLRRSSPAPDDRRRLVGVCRPGARSLNRSRGLTDASDAQRAHGRRRLARADQRPHVRVPAEGR
jgi:serine/threonine protein phosphatase PrpC